MQKISISQIVGETVKPILSDDELDLHFYMLKHLPKKWVEIDKEYTDRVAKLARDRKELTDEYNQVIESSLVDLSENDRKELKAKQTELEEKIKAIAQKQKENPFYELAPLCHKTYEEFRQIILDAAEGDEEIAINVIADRLYEEYLLAVNVRLDEEKKRREATGAQAILDKMNGVTP